METPSAATVKTILAAGAGAKRRFVKDPENLAKLVQVMRDSGMTIVLTQGVYDLIHEGHARYLEMAKELGDILIVGIDSDELTRARKGPSRPVVPENERIEMLTHLRHVDIVALRSAGDGIGDLIRLVKPDVLVTSTSTVDFTERMKEEYGPYCGKILTLDAQAATSTTARIRDLTIEGAENLAKEINQLTKDFIAKIRKS